MAKRKRHPKLPNGYGSIKYLGKGRRNPYAVHPPVTEFSLSGAPITPKALCYTDTWIKGFTVLTAYKAGTYKKGMELDLNFDDNNSNSLESLAEKILADYNNSRPVKKEQLVKKKTFKELYEEFYIWKFNGKRQYAKNTINSLNSAFKRCSDFHDKAFREINYKELQDHIDASTLSHASIEMEIVLIKQMYGYALMIEEIEKNPSQFLKINKENDEEHGSPFTRDELKVLWANKENPIVELILIMCYSGYRITAYKTIEVNLKERYFKGGIKTKTSLNRIVPIHSAILPLVETRLHRQSFLINNTERFRIDMRKTLERLGFQHHTPHDCRHTFSALCEKYGVKENDRKRMLGHSFGEDITNRVYGHREIEDLRIEVEKIQV